MAQGLSVRDLDMVDFQRREWVFERIGWVIMFLLIVAALLGVFSKGPFSETRAGGSTDAVEVTYERFTRQMGSATMTISVGSSAVTDGTATVFISDELVGNMQIQDMSPQPDSATSTRDGIAYEFAAHAASPPVVKISYRPDSNGVSEGTVRAGDGVRLWQLTYP